MTKKQELLNLCDEVKSVGGYIYLNIEYLYSKDVVEVTFSNNQIDILIWSICNSFDKHLIREDCRIKDFGKCK